MSNVQIPNLPAAGALIGTEQMELVQAGVSVRATVSQLIEDAHVPLPATNLPLMNGGASVGAEQTYSRGDHIHPTDTTRYAVSNPAGYQTAAQVTAALGPYALIDSQAFTGTPSMPTGATGVTQTAADSSTKLATTAFVKAQGYAPTASLGTMSTQNANAVAITGGAINGTTVGATTPSTGAFTNLSASGTVSGAGFTALLAPYATTASLGTMSTQNANAVAITGGAINSTTVGATTASTGAFTTLSASGVVSGAGFTTLLNPYALVNSQVFTGTPSLPTGTIGVTQAALNNSTKLATTAYVDGAITVLGLGTMAAQNANAVAITGGAINNTAIGATTRSSGAFTTLAANGAATFTSSLTASPASANVVLSPTGTGTVTINPATLGHVDNTAIGATTASTGAFTTLVATSINSTPIGATTPSTGAFTTLSATGTATFTGALTASPANLSVTFSPTGTGTVTINPATLGTINNMTIGATTAAAGTFTNLTATGTVGGAGFTTLLTPYALVNSQVFTGTPSLPTGTIGVTQAAATNNTTLATTAYVKSQNYLTANQSIALTGDVTGSGTTSIASTVVQLQGRPLSASLPASGNLMGWNGTTWGPVAAGAAAAGGTANQIQYNNGGVLGGLPTTGTFASSNVVMSIAPTLTNSLNITGAASNDSTLVMNKSASLQQCRINAQMGGVSRWQMMLGDTTAEGGSNAGSDFTLSRFTDAGGALDSPLKIIRSTGVATFTQALFSANHTITGAAGNNAAVIVNKAAAGFYSGIDGQTAGSRRWLMMLGNATAEGGSNAGSDFMINRYTDAAGFIDTPLTITRSSGDATFSAGLYVLNSAVTAKQIVINGAALGSVAGNIQTVFGAGSTTTNGEQLRIEVQRKSAGSDWTTAAWQTYRIVDGSKMGYVEYGSQSVKPIAFGTGTTELASISNTGVFTAASTLVGTGAVLNAPAATDSVLWLNKPASGRASAVYGQMAASNRWAMSLGDTATESGSNVGCNYVLSTFTDAGAFLGNPLTVFRASGYMYFNGNGATAIPQSYETAPYGHMALRMNKSGSTKTNVISGHLNGVVRWTFELGNTTAETGTGNTGSDFSIGRYSDAGVGLDAPLSIARSTGFATFTKTLTVQSFDNLGQIRLVGGNYGAGIRNDGASCYLLQTAVSDQYGAFNSARPFSWNLSNGTVQIDGGAAGTTFGGPITTTGQIFTSGGIIGAGIYASGGQMTVQSSGAPGFINQCDSSGNGGQFRNLTIRGLDSAYSAQVNLSAITAASALFTCNGVIDAINGFRCRLGAPGGALGSNVFSYYWNTDNHLYGSVDSTNLGWIAWSSDYRIKRDIAPLPSMWEQVKALKPISYFHKDWTPEWAASKENGDAPDPLFRDDGVENWGFVAHELQETLIQSAATGVKDEAGLVQAPNPWTVIATLTKALQEAMARIEALEARA